MRKQQWLPYAVPAGVLTAILALCLWNGAVMERETTRWREQLRELDFLARSEDWSGALSALEESYQDWSRHQTYLHIAAEHSAVDDAEVLYRRAMAFAQTQEVTEFHAEITSLREQLRLLSEMERLNIRNIL